ncbi:hypothetical protein [Thermococcus sp.]|uniref:hypothetical protein n=1 Tax=Thermococcus sp. TaxID=35749 RepID=UPI002619F91F|nr:hypothetical protein [Thermococcus sp.]
MKALRRLSYLTLGLASLSVALSYPSLLGHISTFVAEKLGLYIPPILLSFLGFLSFALHLFERKGFSLPLTVGIMSALYILPYIGGVSVGKIPYVALSALPLSLAIVMAPYLNFLLEREKALHGLPEREWEAVVREELRTFLLSMVPGGILLVYLLYSTTLGTRPFALLPTFSIPLLVLSLGLLLASVDGVETPAEKTVLVIRAYLTAGDSFEVRRGSLYEKGYELLLVGGTPVKRPVLIRIEDENVPDYIILKSPWENLFLAKRSEVVEGNTRYVIFLPSTSRAPSSQGISSALP